MVLTDGKRMWEDGYHRRNDKDLIMMKKYENECRERFPIIEECNRLFGSVDYKKCKQVVPAFQKCFDEKMSRGKERGEISQYSMFV